MSKPKKPSDYNYENDSDDELKEIFAADNSDTEMEQVITNISSVTIDERSASSGTSTNSVKMFNSSSDRKSHIPILRKRPQSKESEINTLQIPERPRELFGKIKTKRSEASESPDNSDSRYVKATKLDGSEIDGSKSGENSR